MLSQEQFSQIEAWIDVDPIEVAFKTKDKNLAQAIAALQKAKSKAPSFYSARCELTTIMVEQSTSEVVAKTREVGNGKITIDLTCGMGVDSWALGKNFERVIGIEIDPQRAKITQANLKRLEADNVEVICDSAENFLAHFEGKVDLVFCDPSRRTVGGKRLYGLEDCVPNVIELMPKLKQISNKIVIKLSPLFDVNALFDLFPNSSVEIISVNNECKEVVLKIGVHSTPQTIELTAIKADKVNKITFPPKQLKFGKKSKSEWGFILQPDVVFYKSRTVERYLETFEDFEANFESYVFCDKVPTNFIGKSWVIKEIHPYHPKTIKTLMKYRNITKATIIHRHFVDSTEQICKKLGIKEGGTMELILTTLNGKNVILLV